MPGTVTVACKLPNGLHLEKIDAHGVRTRIVTLRGPMQPWGTFSPDIAHGVGLTHGVDADFFAAWMKEHADYAPVKAGLIFAAAKPEEVLAQARDRESTRTGYEPLRQEDIPRGIEVVKENA